MNFWRTAFIIFALLAAANYFPLLLGYIPFPGHLLPPFPAWGGSSVWPPVPEIGDLITSFYPFHAFAARSVHFGDFPLWNPHILSGAPFLANAQSALFYPPNFLYYVLPTPAAWAVCLLIRMFLCALFMSLFVRSIGGSTTGAILSGIVYSSCGFMTAWQGQALGDATIWMPLICYALIRLRNEGSLQSCALAAFAFAMPVLAGHPETAAHSTLIGCTLALVLWGFDRRFAWHFAGAGLLAIGLAAVQIIPTAEWLGQMGRGQFEIPWPALEFHQAQGLFSRDILSSPNSAGISVPEAAGYLGMLAFLAASLAPLHRSRRYVAFLIGVTVVAVMIAYSIEPVRWLVAHAPYLKSMKNGRFIFVASFGAAALAGLGISVLEEFRDGGKILELQNFSSVPKFRRKYLWLLAGAAFTVVLVAISRLQLATQVEVTWTRRPLFSAFLLCVAFLPIALSLLGRLKQHFFSTAILGLAAFDLVSFSYGFIGFSSVRDIYPNAGVFEFLNKNADPASFRAVQVGNVYPVNVAMIYGFAAADGYEICLERPRLFTSDLRQAREDGVFLVADKVAQSLDRRLDMLNVKYLVVPRLGPEFQEFSALPDRFTLAFDDGRVAVFENKRVLPRAFIVPASGIEVVSDMARTLERLKDLSFNPEQNAILSQSLPASAFGNSTKPSLKDDIAIVDNSINGYRFRIQSQGKALLVVSQIYYPGWKAMIDGERVPVVPANYALTGIPVPPGAHDVRFVFDPLSFKIALAITIISVVSIISLVYFG